MTPSYIAIDFDGTIVTHKYPEVGIPVPEAVEVIKDLIKKGHQILLFTMRSGMQLSDAVNYCKDNGIELFGVNKNPTQERWTTSPKCFAHVYIDDAALGCPLVHVQDDRPYVDWKRVRKNLEERGLL